MTIAPPSRLSFGHRRDSLAWARGITLRSGIVADLESRLRRLTTAKRTGPEQILGQYNVLGVLTTGLWLALADQQDSTTNLLRALWTPGGFTDDEMEFIGLGNLRHADNRYRKVNSNDEIWHSEYKRLDLYLQTMLGPCDNTANQVRARELRTDVAAAREIAMTAKAGQAELLWKICNAIVAASIDPDLIAPWEGDLEVDEVLVPLATNDVEFAGTVLNPSKKPTNDDAERDDNQPTRTATDSDSNQSSSTAQRDAAQGAVATDKIPTPGTADNKTALNRPTVDDHDKEKHEPTQTTFGLGYPTNRSRRHGFAHVTGLTLAIAGSSPYRNTVPRVALGCGFAHDEVGAYLATLTAIDHADLFRPDPKGGAHHYVLADMGYPKMVELFGDLLARNRYLICDLPKKWIHIITLRPFKDGETQRPTLGNGAVHCPGVNPHTINTFGQRVKENLSDNEIIRHKARERQFRAGIMPSNGNIRETFDRKRGRQPKDHTPDTVYKMEVYCPAAVGNAQCALKPTTKNNGKPVILTSADIPAFSPNGDLPSPCRPNQHMATVTLTEEQFRRYSQIPRGTFEHTDILRYNRSANERTNGTLKQRSQGGNLTHHTITRKRNPAIAIGISMRIAVANLRIQERWREDIANGTQTPPPRLAQKHHRDTLP